MMTPPATLTQQLQSYSNGPPFFAAGELYLQFYVDGKYEGTLDKCAFSQLVKVEGGLKGAMANYTKKVEIERKAGVSMVYYPK
jgi:hypothetical protein